MAQKKIKYELLLNSLGDPFKEAEYYGWDDYYWDNPYDISNNPFDEDDDYRYLETDRKLPYRIVDTQSFYSKAVKRQRKIDTLLGLIKDGEYVDVKNTIESMIKINLKDEYRDF